MDDVQKMRDLLVKLEERSGKRSGIRPNDIRLGQYAIFVNTFLKRFGKEKVYLVGSAGDKSKLTFFKDRGDADFLLVSGIYEVDVDQLEFNEDNECYVRIRVDERSKAIGLENVDDIYIGAHSLRDLKPELFTFLRAFHTHLTATRYRLQEIESEDTIISKPSKVGLEVTRYRKLTLDPALLDRFRHNRLGNSRNEETTQALIERWKDVPICDSDIALILRVAKVLLVASEHGVMHNLNSLLSFTVRLLKDVMERPSMEKILNSVSAASVDFSSKEEASKKDSNDTESQNAEIPEEDMDLPEMQNTYRERIHMDFVPALRLNGKLPLMNRWKLRAKNAGMDGKLVNEIYEEDIFVVARPHLDTESDSETDFCLSFNIAETKLVSRMTSMQRKVLLIIKAFLKGVFEKQHTENSRSLKLKTYHIKHLLFWLIELNPEIFFAETDTDIVENTLQVLRRATDNLKTNIENKMLRHYFVESNLFSHFENEDYRVLGECICIVSSDPIESLKCYFDLNDGKPCDIVFTVEEVECLLEISKDGGRNRHVDRLEDALVDLQRGFNLGPRDNEMRAPIKEAILDIFRLFLADEQEIDTKIFQQINMFLTEGSINSSDELNVKISAVADHFSDIGISRPDIKQFIDEFDGRPRLKAFIHSGFAGTLVDFSRDHDNQLLETIDRYLSCQDEEIKVIVIELTLKLSLYFFGRKEYPSLSGLV